MTAEEVIQMAENLVEESHDNEVWFGWINSVLVEINPFSKIPATEEVVLTITDGEAEIDTTGYYEVVSVAFQHSGGRPKQLRRLPVYDTASTGWVSYDETVKLINLPETAGSAWVEYYENLTMTVVAGVNVFNLHEKYHDVIVKGVCAKAMQKEEDIERKNDFYGEYMMAKQRMLIERSQLLEPWSVGGEQR